ncbi:MAG: 4Fe-4S dicluster domain-containing protein [Hyphomicrobiales bacterium]|nr:4Fe-4S dicluster domain-containing protein [Hyphomicrobiales bacterium]
MNIVSQPTTLVKALMSGNEAVARAVWEAGARVACAYPGTPSTEILENLATYDDIHTHWSVNEKTSLEVAIGASIAGSRAFCAMKHVGVNVAADPLMSLTLAGVTGGLVIAVADDIGFSSSQNEQDTRYWGRFGHLPIFEPSDSQEALDMVIDAFTVSEEYGTPVIVRMTTRVCHVKCLVGLGDRTVPPGMAFKRDPEHWVMVPQNAKKRQVIQFERDARLAQLSEESTWNSIVGGEDRRVGFVASGPAFMNVSEAFPDAPILKLGFSHPVPVEKIRAFSGTVDSLLVVEETEPLVENALKAESIECHGKDVFPRCGELLPKIISKSVKALQDGAAPTEVATKSKVFPRPPSMCVGCPHLPPYYCLSKLTRKTTIVGDIGCYTLGAGHPWRALDTAISMGASMGMALGMDLGRVDADKKKGIVAVIGDSTFLHMGMQGLLEMTYTHGNVTVMLLDNSTTGMTGGQEHAGTGLDIHGTTAAKVDFEKLCVALGVKPERIHTVDPYELPELYKVMKQEIAKPEPSVIITNQPCVLIDRFESKPPLKVLDDRCSGCAKCLSVGCPAINVTRRETEVRKSGSTFERAWVSIDTTACTGCNLCEYTCAYDAIVPEKRRDNQ